MKYQTSIFSPVQSFSLEIESVRWRTGECGGDKPRVGKYTARGLRGCHPGNTARPRGHSRTIIAIKLGFYSDRVKLLYLRRVSATVTTQILIYFKFSLPTLYRFILSLLFNFWFAKNKDNFEIASNSKWNYY